MKTKPLIAASLLSYPPSLRGCLEAAVKLRAMGYEALQIAPTRGLPKANKLGNRDAIREELYRIHEVCPIVLTESVWSWDNWDLRSKVAFDSPNVAEHRAETINYFVHVWRHEALAPKRVYHKFDAADTAVVELHPGLGMTPNELRERLGRHEHVGLVSDTFHLRREYLFPDQLNLYSEIERGKFLRAWHGWERYMPFLANRVEYVHVQPNRDCDEQDDWLYFKKETELERMLKWHRDNCPNIKAYVVELAPPDKLWQVPGWLKSIDSRMERARCRLEELLK